MNASERTAAADAEFGQKVGSSSDKDSSSSTEDSRSSASNARRSRTEGFANSSITTLRNGRAALVREQGHVDDQDFAQHNSALTSHVGDEDSTDEELSRHHRQIEIANSRRDRKSATNVTNDFDLSHASRQTYARASNLMREALGAEGVVFLDTFRPSSNIKPTDLEAESSSSEPATRLTSDGEHSDTTSQANQPCTVLAFSTIDRSSIRGSTSLRERFDISEQLLARLIRRYPNGHIFNFSPEGGVYSSRDEISTTSASGSSSEMSRQTRRAREGRRLGEVMTGARTIAFFPIWNDGHERFTSCAFVWSCSPLRYFDPIEDLTYLASWSHSILAELRRLDTIAADKAKGTFISSVSHELRSPLHGILAGVEFLGETDLTSFQLEMTQTISMAGRTLLETVNHILDHAKMSSFTRAQRGQRVAADTLQLQSDNDADQETGVAGCVDLARLTEDVVETVVSAHRFQDSRESRLGSLSIAVDMPWRKSWSVALSAGGWTRIVQNLVGNALKYTAEGLITIRLQVGESRAARDEDDTSGPEDLLPVRLTVEDSGIGIAKGFLENDLFTPFKQENTHSSGTGLGLSIVQQICKDVGGRLNITSELGKGTVATVDIPLNFAADEAERMTDLDTPTPGLGSAGTGRSLNVEHYQWIRGPGEVSEAPIGASVMEMARSWLGCDVDHGPPNETARGPVVWAITDVDLSKWTDDAWDIPKTRMRDLANASSHVLVLSSSLQSVSSVVSEEDVPFNTVFIHQPIGPHKLLRAIASDRSSTQFASGDSRPLPTRNESLVSPADYATSISNKIRHISWDSVGDSSEAQPSTSMLTPSEVSSTQQYSVDAASSARGQGLHEETDGGDSEPSNSTVLLVEDNGVNMKILMALMRKLGLAYTAAANGRQAVDAFRVNPRSYFLVLMDINMPIMDGFTATAKIREIQRKKALPRCHIVALTGVTSGEAKEKAFASGADEFFSKPVQLRELKGLVKKVKPSMLELE